MHCGSIDSRLCNPVVNLYGNGFRLAQRTVSMFLTEDPRPSPPSALSGRCSFPLVVGAALALLAHLLGPHEDRHLAYGAGMLTAGGCASATSHGVRNDRVAQSAEQLCPDPAMLPGHGAGEHGPCGYLRADDNDKELTAHPAESARVAPPIPPPHVLAVFGCPAGPRAPPDLVGELQVMRI